VARCVGRCAIYSRLGLHCWKYPVPKLDNIASSLYSVEVTQAPNFENCIDFSSDFAVANGIDAGSAIAETPIFSLRCVDWRSCKGFRTFDRVFVERDPPFIESQ
jgi:hypothetical protein